MYKRLHDIIFMVYLVTRDFSVHVQSYCGSRVQVMIDLYLHLAQGQLRLALSEEQKIIHLVI